MPPATGRLLRLAMAVLAVALCSSGGSDSGSSGSGSGSTPPAIVFGTAWKKEATAETTWSAFQAGFRAFDTANQPRHYNESALGDVIARALAGGMPREQLWVQTKYTQPSGHQDKNSASPLPYPYDTTSPTEEQVRESVKGSLAHLGVDYVDALFLHAPTVGKGLAEADLAAWRGLEAEALAGTARALGASNVNAAQLRTLLGVEVIVDGSRWEPRVRPSIVQNRER